MVMTDLPSFSTYFTILPGQTDPFYHYHFRIALPPALYYRDLAFGSAITSINNIKTTLPLLKSSSLVKLYLWSFFFKIKSTSIGNSIKKTSKR